jgi:hypothetical protein
MEMVVAMPMVVMAMPMVVTVVTMPVMSVSVVAVTVMAATVSAGESLTRYGQRGSGQRQGRDGGCNDLLDPGH